MPEWIDAVRMGLVGAMDEIARLKSYGEHDQYLILDNSSASADWLFNGDGDPSEQLGVCLYDSEEVDRVRKVKKELEAIYTVTSEDWDVILSSCDLVPLQVACAEAWAVLAANDRARSHKG